MNTAKRKERKKKKGGILSYCRYLSAPFASFLSLPPLRLLCFANHDGRIWRQAPAHLDVVFPFLSEVKKKKKKLVFSFFSGNIDFFLFDRFPFRGIAPHLVLAVKDRLASCFLFFLMIKIGERNVDVILSVPSFVSSSEFLFFPFAGRTLNMIKIRALR